MKAKINQIRILALVSLPASFIIASNQVALSSEELEWKNCLYNEETLLCRRTFLCGNSQPPCYRFKIEWKDGISDSYTRDRTEISHSKNIGFYEDPRGGEWDVISYMDAMFIVNSKTKNTIIYNMTIEACRKIHQWDYLCPAVK